MNRLRCCLIGLALLPSAVGAADPTKEQTEYFEKKVRPILVEHCYQCHSAEAKKSKGNLTVDSRSALLQGGDGGPAVVPGSADKSLLISAVRHAGDLKMPPKGKLSSADIETLTRWVDAGAVWPGGSATTAKRKPGVITDDDRKWWAFQPLRSVRPPAAGHPVDAFITERLTGAKLSPAPPAARSALIRRLTFDLHGLPPTPAETAAFESDSRPDAYEILVDRLLASPRYGERLARLWLDLVRYADSDGYRIDDYRPDAWRYRDYVIAAFNADKPYDRFIREQIAGDELYPGDPDARTALGYMRHWIYEYNQRDVRTQWDIILTDITDTTGDVFMGLGMQCARCHDHKFDPILQKDYFALRSFFEAVLPRDDLSLLLPAQLKERAEKQRIWEEKTAAIRKQIEQIEEKYKKKAIEDAITKFPPDIQAMIRKPIPERTPQEHQLAELAYRQVTLEVERLERTLKGQDKDRVLALRKDLAAFDALKPPPLPITPTVTDVGTVAPSTTIPKKGTESIRPAFLTVLNPKEPSIQATSTGTGRRTALAEWLTRTDHPLTARVMVNRLWQRHFGTGLCANSSDIGRLGDPPTHPELLDWLAGEFMKPTRTATTTGTTAPAPWSIKHIDRLIVTSAAYRRAVDHPNAEAGRIRDPENRLLWRGTVRRLDAEQIRDSLSAVTGELDLKIGGPGSAGTEPRRSIYRRVMRNTRDPILDVFDAPFGFTSTAARHVTTTPVQSLMMINSAYVLQRSKALARRLDEEAKGNPDRKIETAYQLVYGRKPTTEETADAKRFLSEQATRIKPGSAVAAVSPLSTGKIPHRDGQAAELKPDGPMLLQVPHGDQLPSGEFTIEAFIYPRSVADNAAVRTVAAKWSGSNKDSGWAFGITGKASRRKPQTLVLQLFGKKRDGSFGEEAIFSDHLVQMNKPYYVAASVTLATADRPGRVLFYLKELSNDDEPLLKAEVPHAVQGGIANSAPLTIGTRSAKVGGFDGLLDDIRLSNSPLGLEQLLFTQEGTNKHTVGYWRFEAKPDVFRDSAGHGLDIRAGGAGDGHSADRAAASVWIDWCHVLLNSSEFLYVE